MLRVQSSIVYAIKILGVLYKGRGKPITAAELSEKTDITYLYLMKIIKILRDKDMVISEQGRYGGYHLARKAEDISLYQVFCAVEGEINLYQPAEGDAPAGKEEIYLRTFFYTLGQTMQAKMREISIKDMIEECYRENDSA